MAVSLTRISPNGQIVIPANVRKAAGIMPSAEFLVFNKGGNIYLQKLGKDTLPQDLELAASILRGEEDLRKGRVIHANTSMRFEKVDSLLRSKKK